MQPILNWKQYLHTAAEVAAEGIVMLKNNNQALPLPADEEIAIFGRIQLHYYKSGTGSGGMVNVARVTGIPEGLEEAGVAVNQELLGIYREWDAAHPFDLGDGWGKEPWAQQEMPLDDALAASIAERNSRAVVVIGRTAGEEQDHRTEEGSYLLTQTEIEMLHTVRRHFEKMIVLLNVGSIMDMHMLEAAQPDAILYVWQGGMTGGHGVASVLTGAVSPCGKLPDTIAYEITQYPSHAYFGDSARNYRCEDLYVGYRYFETFAKDQVRYPFGFGLSYTKFTVDAAAVREQEELLSVIVSVKNTGAYSGKEVVQLYCEAPQGLLGKPARVLCGFSKTDVLAPGASQLLTISLSLAELASYDDSGVTGYRFCYVLEQGSYRFYLGTDVRQAALCYETAICETRMITQCRQAMAPVLPFQRMRPLKTAQGYAIAMEDVPLSEIDEAARLREQLPPTISYTGDCGIRLADVADGTCSMSAFLGQFSDAALSSIVRGEGMGSPRVTPGTASAFGGVSKELVQLGIPAVCCSDGPSGMRLDCGTKAFSLPNGTMIAATFNQPLLTKLFSQLGLEMRANGVDCLLGPGMNLHRHPLNGRNFEYFSEDPYLSGKMAVAELKGLHAAGVEGTIKHFCGNEQETNRHFTDEVISERALREIYLKGFEIAVKEGNARSIMTTYGSVNGLWTAGNPDLNTVILREEWGYQGFVMTDWWANINRRGEAPDRNLFSVMVKAQNDVYMVCADTETPDQDIMSALQSGVLTRGELQRSAANICHFIMGTHAFRRLTNTEEKVCVTERPAEETAQDTPVVFYPLGDTLTLPLEEITTARGTTFSFALNVETPGYYLVTVTAGSNKSALAQMPVTLFSMGTPHSTFTWNGTDGKPVSYSVTIPIFSRFTTIRLYFAQSGLQMHSIAFQRTEQDVDIAAM